MKRLNNVWLILLCVHFLLCLLMFALCKHRQAPFTVSYLIWMILLPVFGPLMVFILSNYTGKKPADAQWLEQHASNHHRRLQVQPSDDEAVPLEEALLVSDPVQRRKQMMSLLRSDPMKNLDLLMLARFNEDTETAHYATATITELQRRIQLEIQHHQIDLQHKPEDPELLNQYIMLLDKYCTSGLIEGQVLRRHRLMLERALNRAIALEPRQEWVGLAVRNELALQSPSKAMDFARQGLTLWPRNENVWFDLLRVSMETNDHKAFTELLSRIRTVPIDWTSAGREKLQFWLDKETPSAI